MFFIDLIKHLRKVCTPPEAKRASAQINYVLKDSDSPDFPVLHL